MAETLHDVTGSTPGGINAMLPRKRRQLYLTEQYYYYYLLLFILEDHKPSNLLATI